MQVVIDDNAGFCFGVVKAIDEAERELNRSGKLYCLGDIVHNNAEVDRLHSKGLVVIGHDDLPTLPHSRVLIRAHGEPPSTYEQAQRYGITLVDATCPIVLALQQRIRLGYMEMQQCGGQVVIFGKPGHAEVIGLTGQTEGSAIVVSNPDDLDEVDFSRPIRLYSQTTKSKEHYKQLIDNIRGRLCDGVDFQAYDTICSRVSHRVAQLQQFARQVDVLLFVSGEGSSNGRYLYQCCLQVQPRTYFLSDVSQLRPEWFSCQKDGSDGGSNSQTVGITGATSTPRWLMEAMAKKIEHLCI